MSESVIKPEFKTLDNKTPDSTQCNNCSKSMFDLVYERAFDESEMSMITPLVVNMLSRKIKTLFEM